MGAEGILPFPWQRPLSSHLLDRLNARRRKQERLTCAWSMTFKPALRLLSSAGARPGARQRLLPFQRWLLCFSRKQKGASRNVAMSNDQLGLFTNRREAIALFNMLRGRDPRRPWPVLPLFVLTAPSGGGKSALIDYLRVQKCCADGCSALPYAYLDFTQPHTPRSLLHILVSLRNQLQGHTDGSTRNLVFPRFDLGASIALAAPAIETLPPTNLRELEICLGESVPMFNALHRLKTPLESVVPAIPYLLEGIIWPAELKPLQAILQRMDKEPGWRWYRDYANDVGLRGAATLQDVLMRLQVLSAMESQEREYLVEEILSAALVADLLDGLVTRTNLYCWDKTTNAVIFLDGFEALLDKSNNRGYRLLEMLALAEQRMSSESDPLLLVVGTRKPLFAAMTEDEEATPEEQAAPIVARRYAQRRLREWLLRLPEDKSEIRLDHLALPLDLQELGARGTRDYLAKLDAQRGTQVFDDEALVKVICQLTYGQPLCLAMVAAAALEAAARGQPLDPALLQNALQSDALVFGQADEMLTYLVRSLFAPASRTRAAADGDERRAAHVGCRHAGYGAAMRQRRGSRRALELLSQPALYAPAERRADRVPAAGTRAFAQAHAAAEITAEQLLPDAQPPARAFHPLRQRLRPAPRQPEQRAGAD